MEDGKILALGIQVQPDGSQSVQQRTFKNRDELAQEREATSKRSESVKAANNAISLRLIKENGGSDIKVGLQHYSHPGNDELRDSLNTFHNGWRSLTEADLYTLVPQYNCPSNVSIEQLQRYRQQSRKHIQETERQSAVLREILTRKNITLLQQDECCLAPIYWMTDQMQRLCVKEEAENQFTFNFGRMARNRTEGEMWAKMIMIYNGHIKSLTEMLEYAR